MINKESIISIFDDKPTLLKWLKKVEEALNNASAVSFNVNKRGNATLTLSIVFEDGSEIESNEFVLEQGESVESAEVVNGVLYLTLTNGDVLNAGNLFNGNITISGNVTAGGDVEATGALKGASAAITGNVTAGGDVEATGALKGASAVVSGSVTADSVATNGGIVAGGGISGQGVAVAVQVSTPKLTTLADEIAAEKPIVEVMTGYSFALTSQTSHNISNIYASVVKNGDKITFVVSADVEKLATAPSEVNVGLGQFNIPNSIGEKLYPSSVTSFLDNRIISLFSSFVSKADLPAFVEKNSNGRITMWFRSTASESAGVVRHLRYEVTFLLSDNLAA